MEKRINQFRGWLPRKPMKFDSNTLPYLEENESFTAPFSRSRIHQWVLLFVTLFVIVRCRKMKDSMCRFVLTAFCYHSFIIHNKETFFNNATRSRIIHHILQRVKYEEGKNKMGEFYLEYSGNQEYLFLYQKLLPEKNYKENMSDHEHDRSSFILEAKQGWVWLVRKTHQGIPSVVKPVYELSPH